MKLRLSTGLAAGLLALSAAPALAAPANVTVRVEGAASTLVESVRVTTTAAPVSKAGGDCSGTSAGGALDRATGGDWDATYSTYGHFITTIKGQAPANDDYWTVWVNHRATPTGACTTELQEGDEVLYFVDRCTYDVVADACSNAPVQPLGLTAQPNAILGGSGEVSVVSYDATGKASPVEGAKVSGPGIAVATNAAGKAIVPFTVAGAIRLQATKPGLVRSETRDVMVSVKGPPPGLDRPSTVAAPDRTAPKGTLTGVKDQQVFTSGPRELRGSFSADPSGIRTVKLRLTKRAGKRCWYFSGKLERFRGTRCGRGSYFTIGDRADWSYLLPAQLGPGRYVLDAIAIDGAGNRTPLRRGSTRVVFKVR
jgi:hypothetical protein